MVRGEISAPINGPTSSFPVHLDQPTFLQQFCSRDSCHQSDWLCIKWIPNELERAEGVIFRSRRGSQKLANPGWWLRNIRDERWTWIHHAFWKLLQLRSSGSYSVLSSCVFITVGHECLQCTAMHTLLSPFCRPADNRDVNQIFSLNIFKEKKNPTYDLNSYFLCFMIPKKTPKNSSQIHDPLAQPCWLFFLW